VNSTGDCATKQRLGWWAAQPLERLAISAVARVSRILPAGSHFSGTLKAIHGTLDDRHPCRSTPRKVNSLPICCSARAEIGLVAAWAAGTRPSSYRDVLMRPPTRPIRCGHGSGNLVKFPSSLADTI